MSTCQSTCSGYVGTPATAVIRSGPATYTCNNPQLRVPFDITVIRTGAFPTTTFDVYMREILATPSREIHFTVIVTFDESTLKFIGRINNIPQGVIVNFFPGTVSDWYVTVELVTPDLNSNSFVPGDKYNISLVRCQTIRFDGVQVLFTRSEHTTVSSNLDFTILESQIIQPILANDLSFNLTNLTNNMSKQNNCITCITCIPHNICDTIILLGNIISKISKIKR